jgi:hypothetical protein
MNEDIRSAYKTLVGKLEGRGCLVLYVPIDRKVKFPPNLIAHCVAKLYGLIEV